MKYCFLDEDIAGLANDPLVIQKEYAMRLKAISVVSLSRQELLYPTSNLMGEKVLLRCTYDHLLDGLRFLTRCGADIVETEADVEQIESWYRLGITHRPMLEIEIPNVLFGRFESRAIELLNSTDNVFLKSCQKGFSAVIRSKRLVGRDPEVMKFLENQLDKVGERMLITRYLPLKTDSFGTRESRHVIINCRLANSSRPLHSIKHTVPKSHMEKAQAVADSLSTNSGFPSNYVLDLGEFIDEAGSSYLDVVEFNPLSCSMCYVNNSVFVDMIPEIETTRKELQMGFEYCYDALKNPQRYVQSRVTNRIYSYITNDRYCFL